MHKHGGTDLEVDAVLAALRDEGLPELTIKDKSVRGRKQMDARCNETLT